MNDNPIYSQRVYQAYQALAAETQSPDVSIAALHRRVGGGFLELREMLRAECYAQRCVVSTGEPTMVSDAARQSAITIDGESFLNVKLLGPPAVAKQPESVSANSGPPKQSPVERYEWLIREAAKLRYPEGERTPEFAARIEATVARRVNEFTRDRAEKALSPEDQTTLRQYREALQADVAKHGPLSPDQTEHYAARINKMCDQARREMADRSAKGYGRSMER